MQTTECFSKLRGTGAFAGTDENALVDGDFLVCESELRPY